MRPCAFVVLGLSLALGACSRASDQRTYTLQGQVLSVDEGRQQATIKHEEIKGLMSAMTMSYTVKEAGELNGLRPGDLITATLVVVPNSAYLSEVKKVGEAPLEKPADPAAPARSGFELLKPGEPVPATRFVDQDGVAREFAAFKGKTVVVTFIYTKCPLPEFCPMMDRHFATLQKALTADPTLDRVHLVSVSFDPLTDTPAVLKAHARALGADPARWTFLTGQRDDLDQFAARFGVSLARAMNDPGDITHNLRTAIVDAEGRLTKIYVGNEWTPAQIVAELKR